jgi:hypothetical protein
MSAALMLVIALLKVDEYSGCSANHSNTDLPSVFSAAGLPVRSDSIASA